jgi:3-methylcrotonyl-CoA carboxylase alpha subunit
MTLLVSLGGNARQVELTRSADQALVFIDGTACPVSAVHEGGATIIDIDGRRETIWCVADRDTVFVHAFGRSWSLEVSDPAEASLRAGQAADAATAPMPGMLVALTVVPGEPVSHGQVIAVIESMKMHTEIAAPRDGVVDRLPVEVGETFDQGAALVTLVPADTDESDEG